MLTCLRADMVSPFLEILVAVLAFLAFFQDVRLRALVMYGGSWPCASELAPSAGLPWLPGWAAAATQRCLVLEVELLLEG